MTNSGGGIEAEQNFDAWGRRRDKDSWALLAPTASTGLPVWLYRGYTGHEMLDQFGLINMNGRLYDPVLGRMLSPDNYVADAGFSQDYNRYTYARNNPLVYNDPDGNFWNFVVGAAIGGFSGRIGKANGAHGWGMFGYIAGGAAIGAATAGIGNAVTGAFGVTAGGVGAGATIGAYAAGGAAGGAFSGASFAALSGSNIGKGALWGGLIGGATGALGGYLKHASFERAIYNSSRYLADCPKCAAMFPNEPGIWLDDVNGFRNANPSTGLPLASGKAAVDYSLESLSVGGKIFESAGLLFSGIRGILAGKGGVQITKHAAERMIERGITQKMVEIGIAKGTKYLDPKNGTFNYVLKNGFASGKDLLIGVSPQTGKVTTVLRGSNLVNKRFIP